MIICQVFLARGEKKKKSYCSAERRNCCVANVLSKQMTSKHMALWMLSSCSLPWVLIGERKV